METKDADKNGAKDNEKAETPSEQKESKKPSSGKPDQLKVAKKLQKIRVSVVFFFT